jgi:hypothetical protein
VRWWKVVGLAGVAGVAATGVVVARDQRRRRAYSPEEIRERLHTRLVGLNTSAQSAERTERADPVGTASSREAEVAPVDGQRRRRLRWPWRRRAT